MFRGAIFDMDGTLTLSEQLHHKAFATVFKGYGVDFTLEDEVRRFAGAGSRVIFSSIFSERGLKVSDEELEKCIAKKKELYTKIVQETEIEVVPGVKDFVKKLHERGVKKIIATGNSNFDAVRFILQKVGLIEYFPNIVSVSEVAHGKPFPDVFIEAARRLGLSNDECVVFEDAVNGVTAAKAAGIRCIALETTTKREDLLAAGASLVVKDYSEISDKILYA